MRRNDKQLAEHKRLPDRILCDEEDRWFVLTREGRRGPFGSRRAAQAEAQLFVETVEYLSRDAKFARDADRDDITVVRMNDNPWR